MEVALATEDDGILIPDVDFVGFKDGFASMVTEEADGNESMRELWEDVCFACRSGETRNVDETCVGCLDSFFVRHLDSDAVIGGFLVRATTVDGKEVSCASCVGYGCGVIRGLDVGLTVTNIVTVWCTILP